MNETRAYRRVAVTQHLAAERTQPVAKKVAVVTQLCKLRSAAAGAVLALLNASESMQEEVSCACVDGCVPE